MLNFVKGKIETPLRVVVYGPEGIGKSTFAAAFPNPVFIDTEGSTNHMDVVRFEPPTDWSVFLMELHAMKQNPGQFATLVVDTADWAMRLCEDYICKKYGKAGIEDFGYGKGYTYAKEEWGKALDLMTDIVAAGHNVVLTAHSAIRKFEKPDEMGAYDRYELKMGGKAGASAAALCKEWADMLLFANYKEIVVEVNGKNKVQGGSRVMYTSHTPTWDAKNRQGLPPELPFDFAQIAKFIPDFSQKTEPAEPEAPHQVKATHDMYLYHPGTNKYLFVKTGEPLPPECMDNGPCKEMEKRQWENAKAAAEGKAAAEAFGATPVSNKKAAEIEQVIQDPKKEEARPEQPRDGVDERILKLCDGSKVTLNEVSQALQEMGQAPGFFPVKDFPPPIVEAVVVHWQEILNHIKDNTEIPF